MKKLNIGIIGLGRIGKVHLENVVYRLPRQAKVVAVSDIHKKNYRFAKELGVDEIYSDHQKVIAHKAVEAVIICSPTFTHFQYIKEAALAGKAIFCEKPLELSLDKLQEIDQLVQRQNVQLQVGFNRRFDANFEKISQLVKKGKIGAPHILKITSRDPSPPPIAYIKGSGGLFMDMTIHDFDMARYVTHSEVVEVYAKAAVLVDKAIGEAGDIDTAIITLKFANGCIGVIDNSRKAVYGYDQRVEIFGSKGMSKIGNNYPDTHMLYNKNGRQAPLPLHFFMDRYTEAYAKEIIAFVQAIRKKKPVPVDTKDAIMATAIAIAANTSVAENRAVRIEEILK